MKSSIKTSNEKSISSLIHLSTLCQYFIPLSNYVLPLLLWSSKKGTSEYVDHQGKQTLNFQLSMLAYSFVLVLIAIPTFIFWLLNVVESIEANGNEVTLNTVFSNQNLTGAVTIGIVTALVFVALKVVEFFLVIYAATKSANGIYYEYPLSINFIK